MRYGVNFRDDGTPLPPTFHIPFTLAAFPYVPHPGMLAGIFPPMPVLGAQPPTAGPGISTNWLRNASRTAIRPF